MKKTDQALEQNCKAESCSEVIITKDNITFRVSRTRTKQICDLKPGSEVTVIKDKMICRAW